jgi:RNA polymerase sigma factor (sigma-70 family)
MTEAQLSNAMDAYGSTVYRLALTRMQNIADAEDVYQEVFLRLWKQAAEDWDGDRAKAWLIRTTLNRCADLGRLRLRRPVLPLEEIADFLRDRDVERIEEKLSRQREAVLQRQRELERVRRKIDNRLHQLREARTVGITHGDLITSKMQRL